MVFLSACVAEQDMSVETQNHYIASVKQFSRWLVKEGRTQEDKLAGLEKKDAEVDRRRERRALAPEEIQRLLEATATSGSVFRGLTGEDRFALYYVALGSGFRASELASLTAESFDLDHEPATVTVEARHSKRRKRDEQPLPPDVVAVVRRSTRWPAGWPTALGWHLAHPGRQDAGIDLEAARDA